jgi:hypothetical protein
MPSSQYCWTFWTWRRMPSSKHAPCTPQICSSDGRSMAFLCGTAVTRISARMLTPQECGDSYVLLLSQPHPSPPPPNRYIQMVFHNLEGQMRRGMVESVDVRMVDEGTQEELERFQFAIRQWLPPISTSSIDKLPLPPHLPRLMVEAYLRSFLLKIDQLGPLQGVSCQSKTSSLHLHL